jgi:hypothetical protein
MQCCGRELPSIDLVIGEEPFVVRRCDRCDTTRWERASEVVDLDAVARALRGERERDRRGRTVRPGAT